jgi:rRNA maturation protein Nop10
MSREKPKCAKCDSHEWRGFLHCRMCGSYFLFGKCKNCDSLRIEKCPVDGGELDIILPKETEKTQNVIVAEE